MFAPIKSYLFYIHVAGTYYLSLAPLQSHPPFLATKKIVFAKSRSYSTYPISIQPKITLDSAEYDWPNKLYHINNSNIFFFFYIIQSRLICGISLLRKRMLTCLVLSSEIIRFSMLKLDIPFIKAKLTSLLNQCRL